MLIYMGELLNAEEKNGFASLTFRSERWDFKLGEKVPFGEGIIITDECKHFMPNYQNHIGETISVSVRPIIGKNKRDVYYLTLTDVLDPTELLTV